MNEKMETTQPNIFAVGDLTEFPLTVFGNHRVSLQHVNTAQHQARIVAKTITGKNVKDDFVPFFWIDIFEKHITFCGDCSSVPEDKVIRGSLKDGEYVCYMFK